MDYQANVGLDVAGRKQILIAVQQFVTKLIPERYQAGARNCEKGDITGWPVTAESPVVTNTPIIASPAYDSFFITANGGLIATQKYYDNYCSSSMPPVFDVEGIVQEVCRPAMMPARTTKTVPIQSK
ncbi:hypothetical protein [Phyllobacterium sp. P30BS-XVII]|uniref:hypothetical protein n=1 Tax=Phyllobacterium sp. P30BS-XVII TaxID=2587046 RepID=UPI000DD8DD93|nr:hypothetical protein [Phyllobacterium sp. P30BS-XVII]MBA8904071.1 hypothetical protein [Phyllobacterium sp. P30BS-XVII]